MEKFSADKASVGDRVFFNAGSESDEGRVIALDRNDSQLPVVVLFDNGNIMSFGKNDEQLYFAPKKQYVNVYNDDDEIFDSIEGAKKEIYSTDRYLYTAELVPIITD